ncbi:hypothetical protein [[Limnothrix rosea] IAM M-220]|uniref:hypothetical protein n=1 Tax=[Limnothrix rosea] IAM M-220 TaxID=454133 RepID=UPI00095B4ECB|nr:hypothetical protein [[Limnothrix rosea] IAM M-220]OKH17700.1 hypothetical protein NIES208_08585 [[Limnothrix rosea] IAM M-220]
MAKRKIRLTDHDPLESKTDSILSSFSTAEPVNKLASQQFKNSTGSQVKETAKAQLKKATYQLDESLLERLDRAYLQMSLDRGRQDTPYKEVLVETAIAYFLDQLEENSDLIEQALARQENRG